MVEEVKNENKNVKSAAAVLKEIEDKNFSSELGKIRKALEDLVPVRDKAQEALNQVNTQIQDKMEEYNEILSRKG